MTPLILPILGCYVALLFTTLIQWQRARRAESRENTYKQMCDELQDALDRQSEALKNQGEALQNLMTATERLRNAQNDQAVAPATLDSASPDDVMAG